MNIVMKKMGDYLRDVHSRLVSPFKRESYIELERDVRRDKLNNPLRSIYVFFNPKIKGVVVFADITEFTDPKDNKQKLRVLNFNDYPLRRNVMHTSELTYVIDPNNDSAQDAIVKDAHHTYKSLINLLYKGIIHGETVPEPQPDIGLIYARDLNGVIGVDGEIPWRSVADMEHFKATTMGQTVVMGRKTWESLPKPLQGRLNVILSKSNLNLEEYNDPKTPVKQIYSIQEIFTLPRFKWIIGGEQLFKEMLAYSSVVYETKMFLEASTEKATTVVRAPNIDSTNWESHSTLLSTDIPCLHITKWVRMTK